MEFMCPIKSISAVRDMIKDLVGFRRGKTTALLYIGAELEIINKIPNIRRQVIVAGIKCDLMPGQFCFEQQMSKRFIISTIAHKTDAGKHAAVSITIGAQHISSQLFTDLLLQLRRMTAGTPAGASGDREHQRHLAGHFLKGDIR